MLSWDICYREGSRGKRFNGFMSFGIQTRYMTGSMIAGVPLRLTKRIPRSHLLPHKILVVFIVDDDHSGVDHRGDAGDARFLVIGGDGHRMIVLVIEYL
jgi:hypothetical protein